MNAKTKIKHTEGPWQTKAEEVGVDYIRVRGTRLGGRYKVANVICPTSGNGTANDRDKEETRANARLVAASPALLNIAKRWAALDGGSWNQQRHAADKAQLIADTITAIQAVEKE